MTLGPCAVRKRVTKGFTTLSAAPTTRPGTHSILEDGEKREGHPPHPVVEGEEEWQHKVEELFLLNLRFCGSPSGANGNKFSTFQINRGRPQKLLNHHLQLWVVFFFNPYLRTFFLLLLERVERREEEREKHPCKREALTGCLLYIPRPGMEPAS